MDKLYPFKGIYRENKDRVLDREATGKTKLSAQVMKQLKQT
jgi:hypothetical protein